MKLTALTAFSYILLSIAIYIYIYIYIYILSRKTHLYQGLFYSIIYSIIYRETIDYY